MLSPKKMADKLVDRLQGEASDEEEKRDYVMDVSVDSATSRRTRSKRHRSRKLANRRSDSSDSEETGRGSGKQGNGLSDLPPRAIPHAVYVKAAQAIEIDECMERAGRGGCSNDEDCNNAAERAGDYVGCGTRESGGDGENDGGEGEGGGFKRREGLNNAGDVGEKKGGDESLRAGGSNSGRCDAAVGGDSEGGGDNRGGGSVPVWGEGGGRAGSCSEEVAVGGGGGFVRRDGPLGGGADRTADDESSGKSSDDDDAMRKSTANEDSECERLAQRSSNESGVTYVKRRRTRAMRHRVRPEPETSPSREESEGEDDGGTYVESFGEGRHFRSSFLVKAALAAHADNTFTSMQVRNSRTVRTANAAIQRRKKKDAKTAGEPVSSEPVSNEPLSIESLSEQLDDEEWPLELGHTLMYIRCTHGVKRKSRSAQPADEATASSSKTREVKDSKFRQCPARITFKAVRDVLTGACTLVSVDEVCYHSHDCSQAMIDANGSSPLLKNPKLQKKVSRMLQCRASARNICDTIAANYGVVITPKQIANLRRDRLGGSTAAATFKLLVERFASFSGSHCLVIDDQDGHVCGVAIQSASQRLFFEKFGDNLILDWTHNTNNLGFYLGSLMTTSVTGRGVSVYDFLCIEQTEDMMTTVLNNFIKTNPDAIEKVKSFVIDKDYKEWRVLERLFPNSSVLLCQFHVVKWFAYVVTQRKYKLNSVQLRDDVLDILYSMVYAKTTDQFDVHRYELHRLLEVKSPKFLEYMTKRWYNCRKMWSDCERSRVFTAMNTTSNRIESSWNQVKKILGKKLRIDLCLEAVFAYQTAVLRREYQIINKYAHRIILRSKCAPFMRSALAEVSEYSSSVVQGEWSAFSRRDDDPIDAYVATRQTVALATGVFEVTRPAAESRTYRVDTGTHAWSCSCDHHVTSGLPCRHMIFIAKRALKLTEFPVEAIVPRWRMSGVFGILPKLVANTTEIQSLRSGLLLSDVSFSEAVDAVESRGGKQRRPKRRIEYFRLKRFERNRVVVLNNLEKRNVIEAEVAPFCKMLMDKSTPLFIKMASELRAFVSAKLVEMGGAPKTTLVEPMEALTDTEQDGDGVVEETAGDEKSEELTKLQPAPSSAATAGTCGAMNDGVSANNVRSECDDDVSAHADTDEGEDDEDEDSAVRDPDWLQEVAKHMKEVDRAIAEAIADEEAYYHDADASQRAGGILRQSAGHASNPVTGTGVSAMDGDLFAAQNWFEGLPEKVDPGDAHAPKLAVGTPILFPHQLMGANTLSDPEKSATELSVQGSHSPASTSSLPVASLPTPPSPTQTLSSNSLSDLSVMMKTVAEHDVAERMRNARAAEPPSVAPSTPSSVVSISKSALSVIMNSVAAHELNAGPASPSGTRSFGKRRVSGKTDSIDIVRELAVNVQLATEEQRSDIALATLPPRKKKKTQQSVCASKVQPTKNMKTADASEICFFRLPPRTEVGTSKQQKTSGDTGERSGYSEQVCDFPIQLQRCSRAIEEKKNVFNLLHLWKAVPRRMDGESLLRMTAFSEPETINPADYALNFRVKRKLVDMLVSSMDRSRELARRGTITGANTVIDLSIVPSSVTSLVVRIGGKFRGFTEENVSDLLTFVEIRKKIESLRLDEVWLQTDGDAISENIGSTTPTGAMSEGNSNGRASPTFVPYLLAKIEVQNVVDDTRPSEGDVSAGARSAIARALQTCSLTTTFTVRSPSPHLQITISLADIAGHIGRRTRLNDCVLNYALRQMAGDYTDVHVFDSLPLARTSVRRLTASHALPDAPLSSFRWLFFPVNYGNVHWTLLCAHVTSSGLDRVYFYDPLQDPAYESLLETTWSKTCLPVLQQWASRDQPESAILNPASECLRLEPQHDSNSCGIYCIAVAYDCMSESCEFVRAGKVGKSVSAQFRVRVLWRILYDSYRYDPADDDEEMVRALALLEKAAADGPHAAITRRSLKARK